MRTKPLPVLGGCGLDRLPVVCARLQYLHDELVGRQRDDLAASVLCLRDGKPSPNGLALLVASLATAGARLSLLRNWRPGTETSIEGCCCACGPDAPGAGGALVHLETLSGGVVRHMLQRHGSGAEPLSQESLCRLAAAMTVLGAAICALDAVSQ